MHADWLVWWHLSQKKQNTQIFNERYWFNSGILIVKRQTKINSKILAQGMRKIVTVLISYINIQQLRYKLWNTLPQICETLFYTNWPEILEEIWTPCY